MRFLAYAFKPGVPPAEIQLWRAGDNPTDYGVHRWTERSATLVGQAYAARGNPLQIDVEHNNGEDKPVEPGPTGGYAQLELRGGTPFLVFAWSAYATDQIATRQRLFLSPDYQVDKATGEIIGLNRVSLVADPGTHHARMLAARAGAGDKGMDPTTKMLISALSVALSGKDPKAAVKQALALLATIDPSAAPAPGNDATEEPAPDSEATPAVEPEAAAAKPAPAAPAPAAEDEEAKKMAAAAKAEETAKAAKVAARAKAPAVTEGEKNLATRVAVLEHERLERETEERFAASSARIPESLHAFAKRLAPNEQEFAAFVAGLPEPKPGTGVRAAARTRGEGQGESTTGARQPLPAEDQVVMDRVFSTAKRPTESVVTLPNGGLRATHLARPKAASSGAGAGKGV